MLSGLRDVYDNLFCEAFNLEMVLCTEMPLYIGRQFRYTQLSILSIIISTIVYSSITLLLT